MLLLRGYWDSPSLFMSILCPKISWLQLLLDNSILWLKTSVYKLWRFGKATETLKILEWLTENQPLQSLVVVIFLHPR